MVEVVIIGSMGLDDIETPFGKAEAVLGGSCTYASLAASFFSPCGIVAVVGEDFPQEHIEFLQSKNVDLAGIERKGRTFRWGGSYEFDMNEAKTLRTELNCLAEFDPKLPEEYQDAKYVFLANTDPQIQLSVLEQMKSPALVVMDTMNFWITHKKETLLEVIRKIDVLLLNDGEARQLFGTPNLVAATKQALSLGPRAIIIKKGEHGALLFTKDSHFNCAGYPLEVIKDPTGCGDCFGGGFIGYLASQNELSDRNIRRAIVYGSVIASFNAEDFSIARLKAISHAQIEERFKEFQDHREF